MASNKYLIEVFWSDEDDGYISIAPDLPGCNAFGDTPIEAIQEINDAISAWLQAWTAMGQEPPEPASKPRPAMAA
ncbi:MAG: type II toxin-antitoxin system HicB family antitoxin [Methylobacter sp.]|jgi:predicted RNase H-like HicB family nuclease|nr:type II toxin-antitoxin system HicB family antitoxin [Methylobacter sp.]